MFKDKKRIKELEESLRIQMSNNKYLNERRKELNKEIKELQLKVQKLENKNKKGK